MPTTLQSRPWKLGDPVSPRFDGQSHIYRLGFCVTCGTLTRECPRLFTLYGTASSGNYGHSGRPGEVGGSGPGDGGGDSFQERAEGTMVGTVDRTSSADTSGGGDASEGIDTSYFEKRGSLPSPKNDPGYEGGYTAEEHAAARAVLAHAATLPPKPMQPLMEPKQGKNGSPELKAARDLLNTEDPNDKDTKVDPQHLLDKLGGNAREQFEAFVQMAKDADPDMTKMVDSMAEEVGGRRVSLAAKDAPESLDPEKLGAIVAQGPPKSLERAVKKVVGKDQADARNVRDAVRMSIAVDHVDQLDDALAAVVEAVKAEGGEIITSEDRFAEPLKSGYRDHNLNVRMANGAIGEIQVHLKSMLYAKEVLGGHKLYEKQRVLTERGMSQPLTPAEDAEVQRLDKEMAKLYRGAWRYGGGT